MGIKLRVILFAGCIVAAPAITTPLKQLLGAPREGRPIIPSAEEVVAEALLADIEARRSARPAADLSSVALAIAPRPHLASNDAYEAAISFRPARIIPAVPPQPVVVEAPLPRQAQMTGYAPLQPAPQRRLTAESFGTALNAAGPGQFSSSSGDTFSRAGPHGVINNRTGQFSPTN